MVKPHEIGRLILDREAERERREVCSCEWAEEDGVEYIDAIDPACPSHAGDWERLHPQESNLPRSG